MIEIKNLVKQYGEIRAVDDLSMNIAPGKIYGLLGKNGAGKSTTMNILTGYLSATSGSVSVCGHDIFKEANKAKKQMGYLPEIPPLYADMTVYEYLMFCGELKGIGKDKREDMVCEVMDKTKITDVENRLIRNLSKGYKQRVGIAQAIMGYPPIIILDEPSVGLDPAQMIEIRELIQELGKEHTILLSSHILSEISAVCDYVYIISKGKLVYENSMEQIQAQEESLEELFVKLTSGEEEE